MSRRTFFYSARDIKNWFSSSCKYNKFDTFHPRKAPADNWIIDSTPAKKKNKKETSERGKFYDSTSILRCFREGMPEQSRKRSVTNLKQLKFKHRQFPSNIVCAIKTTRCAIKYEFIRGSSLFGWLPWLGAYVSVATMFFHSTRQDVSLNKSRLRNKFE